MTLICSGIYILKNLKRLIDIEKMCYRKRNYIPIYISSITNTIRILKITVNPQVILK
jgi:hypothetical protein